MSSSDNTDGNEVYSRINSFDRITVSHNAASPYIKNTLKHNPRKRTLPIIDLPLSNKDVIRNIFVNPSVNEDLTTSNSLSDADTHTSIKRLKLSDKDHQKHVATNKISICSFDHEADCNGCSNSNDGKTPSYNGRKIGDEKFEIIGDGREYKAVNVTSQTLFNCLILQAEEYTKLLKILERIEQNRNRYNERTFRELKNKLFPDETRAIDGKGGVWYILFPDHYGYLHSIFPSFEPCANKFKTKQYLEGMVQPYFKIIVRLVEFCHNVGLFFHDFRLRKFVFSDKQRSEIRMANLTDLCLSENISNDLIRYREICPAYVSPEILLIKERGLDVYAGKPADIWALGVLLFYLLNRCYPFYESSPNHQALFRRIKLRKFSFPINNCSDSARWLIHGLLRQNPAERPTAQELLHSYWLHAEHKAFPDCFNFVPKSFENNSQQLVFQPHANKRNTENELLINSHRSSSNRIFLPSRRFRGASTGRNISEQQSHDSFANFSKRNEQEQNALNDQEVPIV